MNGATRTWSHWPVKRSSASSIAASVGRGLIQRTNTPPPLNPSLASPAHTRHPADRARAGRQERRARRRTISIGRRRTPARSKSASHMVLSSRASHSGRGRRSPVARRVGRGGERREDHQRVPVGVEGSTASTMAAEMPSAARSGGTRRWCRLRCTSWMTQSASSSDGRSPVPRPVAPRSNALPERAEWAMRRVGRPAGAGQDHPPSARHLAQLGVALGDVHVPWSSVGGRRTQRIRAWPASTTRGAAGRRRPDQEVAMTRQTDHVELTEAIPRRR